jgi:CrcB protein
MARWIGEVFPWGTLLINVTGSFVIVFFAELTGSEGRILASPELRTLFMVGICGGYTTFSSFSLQTLNLARDGEWLAASAYILGSVMICLLGAIVGHIGAAAINSSW